MKDEQIYIEQMRVLYLEKNEHLERFLEPVTPFEFYREIFPVGSFERKGHFEDAKGNGIAVTVPKAAGIALEIQEEGRPNVTLLPMSFQSCRRFLIRTLPSCLLCPILDAAGVARMLGISMPWSLIWMVLGCRSSGIRCTR